MAKTPRTLTSESLKLLRELGYTAYYVEGFQHPAVCIKVAKNASLKPGRKPAPFVPLKKDFIGIADIVAFGDQETLYVQVTDQSNVPKHRIKYAEMEEVHACIRGGNHFVIHGWPRDPDSDAECRIHEAVLGPEDKIEWLVSGSE